MTAKNPVGKPLCGALLSGMIMICRRKEGSQRANRLKSRIGSLEEEAKAALAKTRIDTVFTKSDGSKQVPLAKVAQAATARAEPPDWKTLFGHLDIYAEIIVSIQADLRSSVRSVRMVEGSDSQKAAYKEILQWMAVQLNRTKDGIQTATEKMVGAREEDQVGHLETLEKFSQVDREFRALLPRISAARNVITRCSQTTMGTIMWAQIEVSRLRQVENRNSGRTVQKRR
jgi:hypothetical protein